MALEISLQENVFPQNFSKILSEKKILEISEKERVEIFSSIESFFERHGLISQKYQETLPKIATHNPNLLVRRENPIHVIRALEQQSPIQITPKMHYPNAAVLGSDANGIGVAQFFGHGNKDGIVFTIGFNQEPNINIQKIKQGDSPQYSPADHALLRHIEGMLSLHSLRFVVMRVPSQVFPSSMMSSEEIERIDADNEQTRETRRNKQTQPKYIYRLYSFLEN